MKIHYSHKLPVSKQIAFETILDPENLQNVIPGSESFEQNSDNCYSISSKVEFGIVNGLYKSTLEIIDIKQPNSLRLIVASEGTGGSLRGEGTMVFNSLPGITEVVVDGDAKVTGFAATIGQSLLGEAVKALLKQFFDSLNYKTI
tara:strand:+ start:74 stop:508 length:435 start_codon:yes stop_codon:yes gene_type:complete